MTPITADREIARERARLARQARTGRARMIRRRVVSGAAVLFVSAWLLIAMMLVTGHDPALSKQTASVSASSSTPATVTSSSDDSFSSGDSSSSSGFSSSSGSSASSQSSQGSSAPLTTRSS